MTTPKLFSAIAGLSALVSALCWAPGPAQARVHLHVHRYGLPYPISYRHNYGPGPEPGTFAYYDGPATVLCDLGSATYFGQNHRRHPCF